VYNIIGVNAGALNRDWTGQEYFCFTLYGDTCLYTYKNSEILLIRTRIGLAILFVIPSFNEFWRWHHEFLGWIFTVYVLLLDLHKWR